MQRFANRTTPGHNNTIGSTLDLLIFDPINPAGFGCVHSADLYIVYVLLCQGVYICKSSANSIVIYS